MQTFVTPVGGHILHETLPGGIDHLLISFVVPSVVLPPMMARERSFCGPAKEPGRKMSIQMAKSARRLREQAEQYRQIARKIMDQRLLDVLATMAAHYDEEADDLERQAARKERESRIRWRANEIWKERGRPSGRDVEHWHAAEREVDENEAGDRTDRSVHDLFRGTLRQ
jgi:hypothetical protein